MATRRGSYAGAPLPAAATTRPFSREAAPLTPRPQHLPIACNPRFSPSCKAYHGDEGLQELLQSSGVDACLVVLPPQVQGAVVQAALRAGERALVSSGGGHRQSAAVGRSTREVAVQFASGACKQLAAPHVAGRHVC